MQKHMFHVNLTKPSNGQWASCHSDLSHVRTRWQQCLVAAHTNGYYLSQRKETCNFQEETVFKINLVASSCHSHQTPTNCSTSRKWDSIYEATRGRKDAGLLILRYGIRPVSETSVAFIVLNSQAACLIPKRMWLWSRGQVGQCQKKHDWNEVKPQRHLSTQMTHGIPVTTWQGFEGCLARCKTQLVSCLPRKSLSQIHEEYEAS